MLMQNFWVTNKEHYGMLWYFLEWSITVAAFGNELKMPGRRISKPNNKKYQHRQNKQNNTIISSNNNNNNNNTNTLII